MEMNCVPQWIGMEQNGKRYSKKTEGNPEKHKGLQARQDAEIEAIWKRAKDRKRQKDKTLSKDCRVRKIKPKPKLKEREIKMDNFFHFLESDQID